MRRGGLVAYTEDLMQAQVARGDEVAYAFSGRYHPWGLRPRLRRWQRGRVAMWEIVDSPLHDHGRQPALETGEPRCERLFARVLEEVRPDVVHVHELAGLPWSLLDVARGAGVPTVVTLQDYFALCPSFKLLDSQGHVCLRRQVGADCVATMAAESRPGDLLFEATMRHELATAPALPRRVALGLSRRTAALRRPPVATAEAYQRRRDANVARLSRADLVIAMSRRVAEIHSELGVDPARLRTVQLTLAHIERLRPRRADGTAPLTFATLAAFESEAKGARVVLDALLELSGQARAGRFRLLVLGHIAPRFAAEASALPGVELHGAYDPSELDGLLDAVDVGLMPSVWEEAYGYAGVEFLAKGIPLIANAIGGMVDYAREGETGWLNRSCSGIELARIMAALIERPQDVAELNTRVLAARDAIIRPMAAHAGEMDGIYRELAGYRPRA
jgi:glycosyltransferase involved in cell wall biosynthesis